LDVIYAMKRLLASLIWLWALQSTFGQAHANAFLDIGVGAGAMATGGNVTALAGDANAVYWNPAGLTRLDGRYLGLMHAAYFGNMAMLNQISYAEKHGNQYRGAALIRFGVDNIMNTTKLIDENGDVDYNRITYFSAADYALLLGYARKDIVPGLQAGLTLKLLYRHIGDFASGWGFGMDAGVQYAYGRWQLGAVLRDFTGTFTFWTFNRRRLQEIADAIPGRNQTPPAANETRLPSLRLGFARVFRFGSGYGLTAETDWTAWFYERNALVHGPHFSLEPGLGLTADYRQKVFLRLGADNVFRERGFEGTYWKVRPHAGLGVRLKYLQVDYAFTDFGLSGRYSHIFSLILDLKIFSRKQ